MATITIAKNYALKNLVPSGKIPGGEVSGEVFIAYDEITYAAEFLANDLIPLGITIPVGGRILEAYILSPAMTAGTLQLGTSAVPASLITAHDASAAAKTLATAGAADLGVEQTAPIDLQLKATVGSTAATGKTTRIYVLYTYV